jgi:hypothetical protein
MDKKLFILALLIIFQLSSAQRLALPRQLEAPNGSAVAQILDTLSLEEREKIIFNEITSGNIPEFLRTFCPVIVDTVLDSEHYTLKYFAAPEYLAIGSDADFFFIPMTPALAQKIADTLGCSLPTKKIVDQIYRTASVKLIPAPIPPGPQMITMRVFAQHNAFVQSQRDSQLSIYPLGALTAGHKKDIVITNKINNPLPTGRVAIYGWHKLDGSPIQPLYTGHKDTWADYSHGVRLVLKNMEMNGKNIDIAEILKDSLLSTLISDDGKILNPKYPVEQLKIKNEK